MTIDELSSRLGLGRSVTYRIIRTLEDHRLVRRDTLGRLTGDTQLVARQERTQRFTVDSSTHTF